MPFDPRHIRKASELKALAHPLRMDIIEQLGLNGPMTASELGDALGESPANCSWHLRKLAEHAFVEETYDGQGRRRPWKLVKLGMTWGTPAEGEDSSAFLAAAHALEDSLLDRETRRYRGNQVVDPRWGDLGMSENVLLLTEDEARAFKADLGELIMRHRGRLTGDEVAPADARRVHVLALTSVEPS
jgi:DNA-binding transcriptional ArsR family regulator